MMKNLTIKECTEFNGGYGAGMILFGPIIGSISTIQFLDSKQN